MDDSRRRIARLDSTARAGERVPTSEYAIAYAELGDTLATLDWLDSMLVRNDSYRHQIRVDPLFDFLRRDPRYRAWEARCGLPPLAPTAVMRSTPTAARPRPGSAVAATGGGAP
jgi:hypothetical protein